MTVRKFEIEDRRNRDSRFSYGGRVLLLEVLATPFPHKLFIGDYASPVEADNVRRRLMAERRVNP